MRKILLIVSATVILVLAIKIVNNNTTPNNSGHKIVPDASNTIVESFEEYNNTEYPLIASVPEKGVQLYGLKPQGVVLVGNGIEQVFDWEYLTPTGYLPEMASEDFDNDGEDEIGVNLYWGSGTGISIEQLHMVEYKRKFIGNSYLTDHQFMESDYLAQIEKLMQYQYDPGAKEIAINIENKTYQLKCDGDFYSLNYNSFVHFKFEGNTIMAYFPIGIVYENTVSPDYGSGPINCFTARVIYSDGVFTLTEGEIIEIDDVFMNYDRRQI